MGIFRNTSLQFYQNKIEVKLKLFQLDLSRSDGLFYPFERNISAVWVWPQSYSS